ELFRRDRGKALLEIEAQHRARHADGADAGAVLLPRAGVENRANEVQVLFHAGSFDAAHTDSRCAPRGLSGNRDFSKRSRSTSGRASCEQISMEEPPRSGTAS